MYESDDSTVSQERKEIAAYEVSEKFSWLYGSNLSHAQESQPSIHEDPAEEGHIQNSPELPIVDLGGNILGTLEPSKTVYYLAYGSNLSAETFLGRRGIHPISQMNVVVPSLRLTFDLPGVPYSEPCFANTALRDMSVESYTMPSSLEKTNVTPPSRYHKDYWKKGLVGVVYELTFKDFVHVIATEGGGAAYKDIVVPCYQLPADPSLEVPIHPSEPPFDAHTLFAPARPPPPKNSDSSNLACKNSGRFSRPDPSYAQASARYLKLITTGAQEHRLPIEYREYLAQIRPYTVTNRRQMLGQFIFLSVWQPILAFVFLLQRQFQDDKGISPPWLASLISAVFGAVWVSYDTFFFKLFGNGERTIGQ